MPWRRKWRRKPTLIFLPGEPHGQRGLVGYSLWDHKELDTTEPLSAAQLLFCPTFSLYWLLTGARINIALSIFLSLLDLQDNQDSTITVEGSPYWNNDNIWQPSISCHLPCWDDLGYLSKDLSFSFWFQLPYHEGHYCCFNSDVV